MLPPPSGKDAEVPSIRRERVGPTLDSNWPSLPHPSRTFPRHQDQQPHNVHTANQLEA
jgi:hypothetical protein